MISARLTALALVASIGSAGVALAQSPPAGPRDAAAHEPMPPDHMMADHMRMYAERRLKAVHDALNIRPDQEAAFQAFAASMSPGGMGGWAGQGEMMRDHREMGAMTTPERLDAMARMMDEHMARMRDRFQKHAAAVKALYAGLSPDQRHTFDALPALMGHPGMGPHGMGGAEMDEGPPGMGPPDGMGGPPHRD